MKSYKQKIFLEIQDCLAPKLWNIEHGTASDSETWKAKECLGFLSMIQHSKFGIREIKRLWEKTGLKFQ